MLNKIVRLVINFTLLTLVFGSLSVSAASKNEENNLNEEALDKILMSYVEDESQLNVLDFYQKRYS